MWRRCDLHNHPVPNERVRNADGYGPEEYVAACVAAGLDVIGVTPHDSIEGIDAITEAAKTSDLHVIPGVEISTSQGHVLLLAPGSDGFGVLTEFAPRIGLPRNRQIDLETLFSTLTETDQSGRRFADSFVLIAAHVDRDGSLLARGNPLSVQAQLDLAKRFHALEVADEERLVEWQRAGVKQSDYPFTLLRGSDFHGGKRTTQRSTWLYLPEISARSLRHALALPEASVALTDEKPIRPSYFIRRIKVRGGLHDGLDLEFSERTNAIIGPPNAGKSLLIDAIKFAFGISSDLEEVEAISEARMKHQLPDGAIVNVEVVTPDGTATFERVVGGRHTPNLPFRPIVFSQTELTRRGQASLPAIQLLDIHVDDVEGAKERIRSASAHVAELFHQAIAKAEQARELREEVFNPQDGLAVIQESLSKLAGEENLARQVEDAERVADWRTRAIQAIDSWEERHLPALLQTPSTPDVSSLREYLPEDALALAAREAQLRTSEVIRAEADRMRQTVLKGQDDFEATKEALSERLSEEGFASAAEVTDELVNLRARVRDLTRRRDELIELDQEIDHLVEELARAVDAVAKARQALTGLRKEACRRINSSMQSFFAVVQEFCVTSQMEALFDDLKTGTRYRQQTLKPVMEALDRTRLLTYAIRVTSGCEVPPDDRYEEQDAIVGEALKRKKLDELCNFACLWPGDQLDLRWKDANPPKAFHELTEGLRALAVKEISFAASPLPVVSDQPEDAVPTRSIFESFVPTLRRQRIDRQFIIVSHDANVVVASDVDRVIVFTGEPGTPPEIGQLFDTTIRDAALEHLEGGRSAFEMRALRYASLQGTSEFSGE